MSLCVRVLILLPRQLSRAFRFVVVCTYLRAQHLCLYRTLTLLSLDMICWRRTLGQMTFRLTYAANNGFRSEPSAAKLTKSFTITPEAGQFALVCLLSVLL